jgi:hypothetical protein
MNIFQIIRTLPKEIEDNIYDYYNPFNPDRLYSNKIIKEIRFRITLNDIVNLRQQMIYIYDNYLFKFRKIQLFMQIELDYYHHIDKNLPSQTTHIPLYYELKFRHLFQRLLEKQITLRQIYNEILYLYPDYKDNLYLKNKKYYIL